MRNGGRYSQDSQACQNSGYATAGQSLLVLGENGSLVTDVILLAHCRSFFNDFKRGEIITYGAKADVLIVFLALLGAMEACMVIAAAGAVVFVMVRQIRFSEPSVKVKTL